LKKLEVFNLKKKYGDFQLDVSFDVSSEEFVSILGPSGSGKSTLLHIIAGFINPDSGQILKNGKDITNMPANKRNIGVVFQDYALFPYLTVFSNIAFGLKVKRQSVAYIRNAVFEIAEKFGISKLLEKYPDYISGGEKQRVALARAMIVKPEILLMDEPLSSLDAKIREKLMKDLREFHKEFRITVIYVTHDQTEAMFLSDRIILLNNGKVDQIGTPLHLYENPSTDFAKRFLGKMNILKIDGKTIFVRPENVIFGKKGRFEGVIKDIIYLAGFAEIEVSTRFGTVIAREFLRNVKNLKVGSDIRFDLLQITNN